MDKTSYLDFVVEIKHKVTTDSHHRLYIAANWLDGDFAADAPNRKWVGDITYIWTQEGWLYLAVILLNWLLLVPLAVLTMVDMAFGLRARTAASLPANRD